MSQRAKNPATNTPDGSSEELSQLLFDQAADGIFIANKHGRFLEINQYGCDMLGYTREELLDTSIEDLVPVEDLAHDPLALDEMRAGDVLLKELRFRCKDGRLLLVEISARALADGRFISIVRNISQREQIEAQLRESNERFRLLSDSSLTGIYLIQDNKFRYINPAFAHIFGYEIEEIVDKLGPMNLVYSEDQSLVMDNLNRRIEGQIEDIHYEFRGLRKDNSVIAVEVYGRRIDYSGKTGVIGTLMDISQRKHVEEELKQTRETALNFSDQLAILQEVTNKLSKAQSSDDLIRQAVQFGRSHLGFDRVSVWFIDENQGVMQGSFGTDELGQLRDERAIQVAFVPHGLSWRVFSQKEPLALVERIPLHDHLGHEVGEGDNAVAALWNGDEVVGVVSVDNLFSGAPIKKHQLEILRLYASTLGHLITQKQAEEALRNSEERLQFALDAAQLGQWDWNIITEEVTWSPQCLALYGLPPDYQMDYERFLQAIHPNDRDRVDAALSSAVDDHDDYDEQKRTVWPDGSVHWTASRGRVIYDAAGQPTRMTGVTFDISKWKEAEETRQTHLRFFENMDRVNRAIQGTNELEQMMGDVLDEVLAIFDCDRSALVYPCDPETDKWRVPMERTKPEYPGARLLGEDMPIDVGVAESFQIMRAADGPVRFGPESEYPLPQEVSERFGFQSFIGMALYPKVGKPWEFILHQCSYPRVWTPEEVRLFQEIGWRLADALTGLLAHRNLQESEERYRLIAENTADTISVFDLNLNPIYISPSIQKLRGVAVEEAMAQPLDKILTPDSLPSARETLEIAGKADPDKPTLIELEQYRKDGATIWVELVASAIRNKSGQPTGVLTVSRDISERKRAQDALALFRTLIDHTKDPIEVVDPETGRFLDANKQAWSILGYTREEFLSLSVTDINPKVAEVSWQTVLEEFRQASYYVRESEHQRKDGSIFPVEINISYIRLDRDYVVVVARDITERKQAEAALRASEERFRALYLDNPSMFFTLDCDEKIISVNAFGASQLGYTIEELEGRSILEIFFEKDRTAVSNHLQLCLQNPGKIDRWESRKVRKDGSVLWVEEFARAVVDPSGTNNILIVCQNITDRKQAEIGQKRLLIQIQEQAQQVKNIINTVPEGVILLSHDQFVTLTNPVARQYLTLLAPDFQNNRLTHLGQRPLSELLTSPPKGLWHELTHEDTIFEAVSRPVENGPENGGWVLVLRDITQERNIQQRVQRQERMAAVGQLAAGIAHDFNNILAVIVLYTQLISRTVEMPARSQEKLRTIEQQTHRATDLIQQILDFSRQSILERQPMDLLPFIEKLVILLERTLPEHIQIELVYANESYLIQADPSRIQQVLMNLAVNARDAMPKGGNLKFELSHLYAATPKTMSVQDLAPGDWIQIAISDSGEGIPQEVLAHIFEPFFTTKQVGAGTGLGLAQVYGIVQQHEGHIDVRTEIGQGTTFLLYFPALTLNDNVVETSERDELLQLGQGQKILLVEDNQVTRKALKESLAQLNYDVLAVTNGRFALEVLATEAADIDLVLSDVVMPEMGGVALFHAMQERNLTIPIVLLTGHPLSKEMENLQQMGLAGWLTKPTDLVDLSYLLADVLASR